MRPRTLTLHTAPPGLQRIHERIHDVDKTVAALMAHTHAQMADQHEYLRLQKDVVRAFKQLGTVMSIELELEGQLGPESFEVRE